MSDEKKAETKTQVQNIKARNSDLQDAIKDTALSVLEKEQAFQVR